MIDIEGGGIPLTVVNLDELEEWILNKTKSELDSIKEEAYDLCELLSTQIASLLSASEILLNESEENLGREAGGGKYRASRAARRLARNIVTSLQGIEIPDNVSYDRLRALSNSLARVVSEIASARAKWEDQTTPFFLLTMRKIRGEYDRLVELNRDLNDFVSSRYNRARKIEDVVRMIEETNIISSEAETIINSEQKMLEEISKLEKRQELVSTRLTDLEKTPIAIELKTAEEEDKKARKLLKAQLRSLRRPFKKLLFLVKKGRLDLTPEKVELLKRCEDGIDLDHIERTGLNSFLSLIETMKRAIDSNRLSLKKEERTKVVKTLDAILNRDILDTELEMKRRESKKIEELLSSKEGRTYQERKNELKREIGEMETERAKGLKHLKRTQKRLQKKQTEIEEIENRIEKNILDLLGERITVELRRFSR